MKADKIENRKKADEYFHAKPENFNCAQAVLKAFQDEFDISEQEIAAYKAYGGGRAENGICGALFAAKRLSKQSEKESLEKEFVSELGTIYCRELKLSGKACLDCVRLADSLVEKEIEKAKLK